MPEINQAAVLRWVIVFLQYGVLLGIYYFIYRVGRWISGDLAKIPVASPPKQLRSLEERQDNTSTAYVLVLEAGESCGLLPGDRMDLRETTAIGRYGKHNSIVIQESFVSAEHALIQLFDNQYWISDLNSTNGTFVNGRRIEDETPLKTGDQIRIGSVNMQFFER